MGQRSQIYVRFFDGEKIRLIANYYSWNYGERMISRARYGIETIKTILGFNGLHYNFSTNITKLQRIFDVNFDMDHLFLTKAYYEEYWIKVLLYFYFLRY